MNHSFLFLTICLTMAASASAFLAPCSHRRPSTINKMAFDAPPAILTESTTIHTAYSSDMNQGIHRFLSQEPTIMTSSQILSLKDRPPPPTAEEIAAKKRTFNLWFWGGGFVAPFLATFYYFGFKFWER
jgi:hypothetical protein